MGVDDDDEALACVGVVVLAWACAVGVEEDEDALACVVVVLVAMEALVALGAVVVALVGVEAAVVLGAAVVFGAEVVLGAEAGEATEEEAALDDDLATELVVDGLAMVLDLTGVVNLAGDDGTDAVAAEEDEEVALAEVIVVVGFDVDEEVTLGACAEGVDA